MWWAFLLKLSNRAALYVLLQGISHIHFILHDPDENIQESKGKMEGIQSSLGNVTAVLFAMENDRGDANATLEQQKADEKVIQTIIKEDSR